MEQILRMQDMIRKRRMQLLIIGLVLFLKMRIESNDFLCKTNAVQCRRLLNVFMLILSNLLLLISTYYLEPKRHKNIYFVLTNLSKSFFCRQKQMSGKKRMKAEMIENKKIQLLSATSPVITVSKIKIFQRFLLPTKARFIPILTLCSNLLYNKLFLKRHKLFEYLLK